MSVSNNREARHTVEVARPIPAGVTDQEGAPEDDKLFDVKKLRESIWFVAQSVREDKYLALATFVLLFGTVAAMAAMWPKTYEADGRLLMQRNDVTASLVNPARTIPREAESPTLAAREIVLGRENVMALIETTNLLEEWQRTRPLILRAKDWLVGLTGRSLTEDDRIDAIAGLIENRLQVATTEEGAISFFISWPDPVLAYRLVDEAMKSFLEYRRANETAAITESISILDQWAATLENQIAETVTHLPRPRAAPAAPRPPRVQGPSPEAAGQLSRLKAELEERQQEIARLAAARSQQLSEAWGRLATARTVYTEDHPTVVTLRQTVEQLSRDSPDLVAARRQARELEAQYEGLSLRLGSTTSLAQSLTAAGVASVAPFSLVGIGEDTDPATLRLRVETAQLASVRERASAARAELASAQAGFKYRYSVTRPARVPRNPASPNVTAIVLVGAIAGLVLAVVVPVTRRMATK